MARYNESKLVVAAFIHELAKHVPSADVVVNHVCPGLVTTALGRTFPPWLQVVMWLYRKAMAREPEEGARMIVYAAVLAGKESHGEFMRDNQIIG